MNIPKEFRNLIQQDGSFLIPINERYTTKDRSIFELYVQLAQRNEVGVFIALAFRDCASGKYHPNNDYSARIDDILSVLMDNTQVVHNINEVQGYLLSRVTKLEGNIAKATEVINRQEETLSNLYNTLKASGGITELVAIAKESPEIAKLMLRDKDEKIKEVVVLEKDALQASASKAVELAITVDNGGDDDDVGLDLSLLDNADILNDIGVVRDDD